MQSFGLDRNTILLFSNLFTLLYILLLLCPVFTSLDCKAIPCPAIEIDCLLFYFEYTCNMLEKFTAQCRSILFTFCCSCCTSPPVPRAENLIDWKPGRRSKTRFAPGNEERGREGGVERIQKLQSTVDNHIYQSHILFTRLSSFKRFAKMRGWQVVLHHPFC